MPPTSAQERWAPIVSELEASGQPLREFAAERDVNPSTLSWWRSRLRRLGEAGPPVAPVGFAELTLAEPEEAASTAGVESHLVLHLDAVAAHVRVDRTTDLRLLRAVMEALC